MKSRDVLIPSQSDGPLLNAVLGDDFEGDFVAGVDLALGGRDEEVVDEVGGFVQGELLVFVDVLHVLEADLVVQERLEEGYGGSTGAIGVLFAMAHRVVGVHHALAILVQSGLSGKQNLYFEAILKCYSMSKFTPHQEIKIMQFKTFSPSSLWIKVRYDE